MGTWISNFFDNEIELAADVRNDYVDGLTLGSTGRQATKEVIEGFAEELDDPAMCPVVWMALAVTQWKYGRLEPRVKAKALKAIAKGGDVALYPEKRQQRRQRVLDKVREQLQTPQPKEKPVRVVTNKPLKKIERLWRTGQVVSFRCDDGRFVLLLTEHVIRDRYWGEIPTFVLLKWKGKKIPDADRIAKLKTTKVVLSIYPNKRGAAVPWDHVDRLDATHEPSGLVHSLGGGVYCPTGFDSSAWNDLDECFANL